MINIATFIFLQSQHHWLGNDDISWILGCSKVDKANCYNPLSILIPSSFFPSVRVSNELGKGDSRAAKFSIVNIVVISLAIGLVLFALFLVFRKRLAYVFTEDRAVVAEVARLSPLLAFSILMNSVQPVLSGESWFFLVLLAPFARQCKHIVEECHKLCLVIVNRSGDWGRLAECGCLC